MILALLGLLLLPVFLAPFETAGWFANRTGRRKERLPNRPVQRERSELPSLQLVYFTGVAGYSGKFLARREKALLQKLQESVPGLSIHRDIFPYSVANVPLDGERVFRWFWMWLHKWRLKVPNNVFDALIVLRNIGQLLVSADPRYGPTFNEGLAIQLRKRLDPDVPTVFLAYSGGAQMAVGAAGQLGSFLTQKPHLLALGGVFTDDPNIARFQSVTQFLGTSDHWVPHLGKLIFPGLWRWQFWSAWNRYRKSSRYEVVRTPGHCHVGKCDYFGFQKLSGEEERDFNDLTAELLIQRLSLTLSRVQ